MENIGIYKSLVAQLDRLARHNRQGSFRTKERYYEAEKRFCAFLAEEYRLQKLANVSGKHLVDYYGLESIVNTAKQLRTLESKALSFISTVSRTPIEQFRCYNTRQSIPQHSNF